MIKQSKTIPGGLTIIFEGVDGVGKTTQLKKVQEALTHEGWPVHITRNLGGTPIGEELRAVAFSPVKRLPETDLYISAAIQAELAHSIETERAENKIVLVDRGPFSFAAYHIYGNGVEADKGWKFADDGMERFRPDLVLVYEMDLDDALTRARQRSGDNADYYASKPKGYFANVQRGYREAAKRYKTTLIEKIDASKSVDSVFEATMLAVSNTIGRKSTR